MVEHAPHPDILAEPGGLLWRRSWRRRKATEPEAHQELVVLHGLQGHATYMIDGVVHELRQGTILWALAGQRHFLLSDSVNFDMWVALVSDRILAEDSDLPPIRMLPMAEALAPRQVPQTISDTLDMMASAQTSCTSPLTQAAGLRLWLAHAWRHWQLAADDAGKRTHPAVTKAAQMWHDNPARSLTDISREAGLSASRLGRLFKSQIGQDVVAYRTEQKLRIFELIRATNPRLSLLSAALESGFGSYAQFYRAWRHRYGTSPAFRDVD